MNIYRSQHLQREIKKTVYTSTFFKAIKTAPMRQNRYAIPAFLTATLFLHTYCNQFSVRLSLLTQPRRNRQSLLHSPQIAGKGEGDTFPQSRRSPLKRSKAASFGVNLRLLQQLGLQCSIGLITTAHEQSRATELSV